MPFFDFERPDVSIIALDFAEQGDLLCESFPGRRKDLADQLARASTSILLNIAEVAGEFAPAERKRFFRMSRRSAMECAAALSLAQRRKFAKAEEIERARGLLHRIASMLTVMVRGITGKKRVG
jgi:four helix bundle protein